MQDSSVTEYHLQDPCPVNWQHRLSSELLARIIEDLFREAPGVVQEAVLLNILMEASSHYHDISSEDLAPEIALDIAIAVITAHQKGELPEAVATSIAQLVAFLADDLLMSGPWTAATAACLTQIRNSEPALAAEA